MSGFLSLCFLFIWFSHFCFIFVACHTRASGLPLQITLFFFKLFAKVNQNLLHGLILDTWCLYCCLLYCKSLSLWIMFIVVAPAASENIQQKSSILSCLIFIFLIHLWCGMQELQVLISKNTLFFQVTLEMRTWTFYMALSPVLKDCIKLLTSFAWVVLVVSPVTGEKIPALSSSVHPQFSA